jgi:hypothetical protein
MNAGAARAGAVTPNQGTRTTSMTREFAKELKNAGFPDPAYRPGRHFFPHENSAGWSDFAHDHGVTIGPYELENRLQDIKDGYYCPGLSDLLDACGQRFTRLSIVKDIWFAECDEPATSTMGESPEEAVGRLWLALNGKALQK